MMGCNSGAPRADPGVVPYSVPQGDLLRGPWQYPAGELAALQLPVPALLLCTELLMLRCHLSLQLESRLCDMQVMP